MGGSGTGSRAAGSGGAMSRRRLGARLLALGGVLVLHAALPGQGAGAAGGGAAERRALQGLRLRYGSARRAGLLERHLEGVAEEARRFLGPSPEHPYYAGAVVLAGRGRTVALHRAMGDAVRYADYDGRTDRAREFPAAERIAMAEDTVFDLASLSKLFTSILAVQQMERGLLELEAPVERYLREFTGGGKEAITVRQLLTHTSGLRSWAPFYQESTRAGQLRLLWSVRPQDTPGTVYRYSDLNLITLQLLLERLTGHTLDVLLQEEIAIPLGMHRTRYNPPLSWRRVTAATEVQRPPWSGLDRGLVWGEVHDENAHALGGVAGHAGVFGTAWDLAVLSAPCSTAGPTRAGASCAPPPSSCSSPTSTRPSPATTTAWASSSTSTGTWAPWPPRTRRGTPGSPGPRWSWTPPPTPSSSCWATPSTRCGPGGPAARPGWRPATASPARYRSAPGTAVPPGTRGWRPGAPAP